MPLIFVSSLILLFNYLAYKNYNPFRERLSSWLEKRNHSLDNFKHLKCFGAFGPVVKRPQTPFRKVALSSSLLKAIPESKESTPVKGIPEVGYLTLQTPFTLFIYWPCFLMLLTFFYLVGSI